MSDVPYGGLGIRKLQFSIIKREIYSAINLYNFRSSKPWIRNRIRIHIDLKCWIRIRMETSADPKHWIKKYIKVLLKFPHWIHESAVTSLLQRPDEHRGDVSCGHLCTAVADPAGQRTGAQQRASSLLLLSLPGVFCLQLDRVSSSWSFRRTLYLVS
jgi:hypothetical protein